MDEGLDILAILDQMAEEDRLNEPSAMFDKYDDGGAGDADKTMVAQYHPPYRPQHDMRTMRERAQALLVVDDEDGEEQSMDDMEMRPKPKMLTLEEYMQQLHEMGIEEGSPEWEAMVEEYKIKLAAEEELARKEREDAQDLWGGDKDYDDEAEKGSDLDFNFDDLEDRVEEEDMYKLSWEDEEEEEAEPEPFVREEYERLYFYYMEESDKLRRLNLMFQRIMSDHYRKERMLYAMLEETDEEILEELNMKYTRSMKRYARIKRGMDRILGNSNKEVEELEEIFDTKSDEFEEVFSELQKIEKEIGTGLKSETTGQPLGEAAVDHRLKKQRKEMELLAEIRYNYIRALNRYNDMKRALKQLIEVAPGLTIDAYMSLADDVENNTDKVEIRNSELEVVGTASDKSCQILAHVKEKLGATLADIELAKLELNDYINDVAKKREQLIRIRAQRQKLRKTIAKVKNKSPLLHDDSLHRDYNATVIKVDELTKQVKQLKYEHKYATSYIRDMRRGIFKKYALAETQTGCTCGLKKDDETEEIHCKCTTDQTAPLLPSKASTTLLGGRKDPLYKEEVENEEIEDEGDSKAFKSYRQLHPIPEDNIPCQCTSSDSETTTSSSTSMTEPVQVERRCACVPIVKQNIQQTKSVPRRQCVTRKPVICKPSVTCKVCKGKARPSKVGCFDKSTSSSKETSKSRSSRSSGGY